MGNAAKKFVSILFDEHTSQIEDLSLVDDVGEPEPTDKMPWEDVKILMGVKEPKKDDRKDTFTITATLYQLTGKIVENEVNSVFGKRREQELVMEPKRTLAQHRAKVEKMVNRGYAFDADESREIDDKKFSPRELAPIRQAILGIINFQTDKANQFHKDRREKR